MDRINVNIKTDRKDENHVYNHGGAFATKRWHNAGRTHYSEKPFNDIHWDGDTEGRDCIEIENFNLYRVADYIPPEYIIYGLFSSEYVIDGSFSHNYGENEYSIPISVNMIKGLNNNFESIGEIYAVSTEGGLQILSCEAPASGDFNIEKPGTYFVRRESEDTSLPPLYVSALISPEIVHQLPSKFIPGELIHQLIIYTDDKNGYAYSDRECTKLIDGQTIYEAFHSTGIIIFNVRNFIEAYVVGIIEMNLGEYELAYVDPEEREIYSITNYDHNNGPM